MLRLYDRYYELIITSNQGEQRTIKSLRVNFEITKSVVSAPNIAKISIYNANESTLNLLQRKYTRITFNAGYRGFFNLLYTGQLRNVFQTRQGVDSITTIYAGDGQQAYDNATFNKTFSGNITIKTAVMELLKTFEGLSIGPVDGVPDVADKLRGQTLSGASKTLLDNFSDEYGFTWSIQDNELVVVPVETPLANTEAVLVTANTGMINSPTITELGVDVTTLLNPRLLPNKTFKIQSIGSDVNFGNINFINIPRTKAEGIYKILEVTFKGDSRQGDWTSAVKGRFISAG